MSVFALSTWTAAPADADGRSWIDGPAMIAPDPGPVRADELAAFARGVEALKAARARAERLHAEDLDAAFERGDRGAAEEIMDAMGRIEHAAIRGLDGIGWERFWEIHAAVVSGAHPELTDRYVRHLRDGGGGR